MARAESGHDDAVNAPKSLIILSRSGFGAFDFRYVICGVRGVGMEGRDRCRTTRRIRICLDSHGPWPMAMPCHMTCEMSRCVVGDLAELGSRGRKEDVVYAGHSGRPPPFCCAISWFVRTILMTAFIRSPHNYSGAESSTGRGGHLNFWRKGSEVADALFSHNYINIHTCLYLMPMPALPCSAIGPSVPRVHNIII